uniref:Uncharacterized protein n=1 Tax=Anopheles darlingi TaxID=43151 RepID=A0A2M4DHR6_ANODA
MGWWLLEACAAGLLLLGLWLYTHSFLFVRLLLCSLFLPVCRVAMTVMTMMMITNHRPTTTTMVGLLDVLVLCARSMMRQRRNYWRYSIMTEGRRETET